MDRIGPDALYSCLLSDLRSYASADGWDPLPQGRGDYHLSGRNVRLYAQQHLLRSILKKFQDGKSDEAGQRAVALFSGYNARCARWESPSVSSWGCHSYEAERLQQMLGETRRVVRGLLLCERRGLRFSSADIFANGDFGPGSSTEVRGTSFLEKLSEPLTCHSNQLIYQFLEDALDCPNWLLCELNKSQDGKQPRVVRGSKTTTVPKDREIDRTICTEPSLSMYYQRGLGVTLDKLMAREWGYYPSLQPDLNREMARLGSLDSGPDGSRFCTIDLKSASDTIARKLVKWLLPQEAFYWFDLLRCRETLLPARASSPGKPEWVELHMISSMGNGFTFSLQTLIFTAVVRAVYSVLGIPWSPPQWRWDGSLCALGNYGVFGDDIVCVKEAYLHVVTVLEALGFVVNRTKSFAEGNFRESCGSDFLLGVDVRGVYCKTLETPQDRISLLNRLVEWSVIHDTPLPSTFKWLWQSLRERDRLLVPFSEDDSAGIKVPWRTFVRLKGPEISRDVCDIYLAGEDTNRLSATFVRRATSGGRRPGKWNPVSPNLKTAARSLSNTGAVAYPRFEVKGQVKDPLSLASEPIAILLAASKGSIRGGKVALRSSEPLFLKRTGVVPTWDSFGTRRSKIRNLADGWRRWSNAVDVLI